MPKFPPKRGRLPLPCLQSQGRVYAKGYRICTEGIETEISIYSASGSLLYQGFDQPPSSTAASTFSAPALRLGKSW